MSEERLQKILAQAGVASRREAEKLILAGRVKVNGKVVRRFEKNRPNTEKGGKNDRFCFTFCRKTCII